MLAVVPLYQEAKAREDWGKRDNLKRKLLFPKTPGAGRSWHHQLLAQGQDLSPPPANVNLPAGKILQPPEEKLCWLDLHKNTFLSPAVSAVQRLCLLAPTAVSVGWTGSCWDHGHLPG